MKKDLLASVLVIFAASYLVSFGMSDNWILNKSVPVVETSQPSSRNQTDLKVEPSRGDPIPLSDYNLQGSTQAQQETAGDLQNPQTTDDLQPNARTDLFSDDL